MVVRGITLEHQERRSRRIGSRGYPKRRKKASDACAGAEPVARRLSWQAEMSIFDRFRKPSAESAAQRPLTSARQPTSAGACRSGESPSAMQTRLARGARRHAALGGDADAGGAADRRARTGCGRSPRSPRPAGCTTAGPGREGHAQGLGHGTARLKRGGLRGGRQCRPGRQDAHHSARRRKQHGFHAGRHGGLRRRSAAERRSDRRDRAGARIRQVAGSRRRADRHRRRRALRMAH